MAPPWRTSLLPPDWATYRRPTVLDRDAHTCQIQGPRCLGRATEVDHMGAADDHRIEMLRAVCKPCHATRTGRQGRAAQPKRARETEPHPGIITN